MAAIIDMYLLKDDVKLEAKKEDIKQFLLDNGEDPNEFDIDKLAESEF